MADVSSKIDHSRAFGEIRGTEDSDKIWVGYGGKRNGYNYNGVQKSQDTTISTIRRPTFYRERVGGLVERN